MSPDIIGLLPGDHRRYLAELTGIRHIGNDVPASRQVPARPGRPSRKRRRSTTGDGYTSCMSAVQQAIGYRVLAGASLASWIAAGTAMPADAQSWDRFRGPMGAGVATTTGLPAQLEGSLVWEAALPAGKSSPIVSGDRLFVTAWEGDTRHVICLDRKTGRRIWQRQLLKLHERDVNRLNDPAAPTPATDGERVFAFFPEAGLVAYAAHDGTERWFVPLGPFNSVHGMAASPIVANGLVILPIEQQTGGSFLTALDAATGARRWQTTLADTGQQGYGTAFVHESSQGRAEIVMSRPGEIGGWSLATGDPIWWVRGTGTQVYSVPAVSGSIIYAAADGDTVEGAMQAWEQWLAKYKRTRERTLRVKEDWGDNTLERADRTWGNQDGLFDEHEWRHFVRNNRPRSLIAVRLGGASDVSETHVLWRTERAVPTVPSPLLYDGILYYVRDGGILTALDPEDGRVLKEARLDGAIDKYFASPVAADGKLYLASEAGHVVVVRAGRAWEVLSVHSFDEPVYATPAISEEGVIYIRTARALYAFGAN
jgi:outer membrane protein assembly factor BamB